MLEEIPEILKESGSILQGRFTLRSGEKSNIKIELEKTFGNPYYRYIISQSMCRKLDQEEVTSIISPGGAADVLANIVASNFGLLLSKVTRNLKGDILGINLNYHTPSKKDIYTIIEDVASTGGSMKRVYDLLTPTGAKVKQGLVVVLRQDIANKIELPFNLDYLTIFK